MESPLFLITLALEVGPVNTASGFERCKPNFIHTRTSQAKILQRALGNYFLR